MNMQELERYQPIPRGGLKLLGVLFVGFLFATICFFLSRTNWEGSLMVVAGRTAAYLVLAGIGASLFHSYSSLRRFGGYWRRNIRSYDACFWIKNDEGVDPDIGVQVMERHRAPYWMPCEANEHGKIFLRVPLGGWFRRSGLLYRVGGEYPNFQRMPFRAWRIKVRQPITDPLVGACIEVIDGKGDRVPLTVSETLRFATWIMRGGSSGFQEWRHEVPYLLRAVREGRAELAKMTCERDEAKKRIGELESELGAAVAQREDAILTLDRAIVAIDATKRFQHHPSKEAKRIREEMIADLLRIAPPAHPLRERYEKYDGQRAAS